MFPPVRINNNTQTYIYLNKCGYSANWLKWNFQKQGTLGLLPPNLPQLLPSRPAIFATTTTFAPLALASSHCLQTVLETKLKQEYEAAVKQTNITYKEPTLNDCKQAQTFNEQHVWLHSQFSLKQVTDQPHLDKQRAKNSSRTSDRDEYTANRNINTNQCVKWLLE